MRCRGLARPVSDTRQLPQRAGPPGQSAIRTLSVLPPVQDTWPEFRLPGPRAPTRHYSLFLGVAPKSLRASCCPKFPPGMPRVSPRLRESYRASRSFIQVSRSCPQDSRSLLRVVPVFAGREVLQPLPLGAQVGSQNIFMILLPSTGCPLPDRCCPQIAAISTASSTALCAQAGRGPRGRCRIRTPG